MYYWRVHGNERKVTLTGLAAANGEGDKLPVFVPILGIKLLLQKFVAKLAISNQLVLIILESLR